MNMRTYVLSHVQLFVTAMDYSPAVSSVHGTSQKKTEVGYHFPFPGDLPNPGFKPTSLMSPALASGFFTTRASREAPYLGIYAFKFPAVSASF